MSKSKKNWKDGNKRTLLLNVNYEVLNFVTDWRAVLMLVKGRADVVSTWDDKSFSTPTCDITTPATLRLREPIRRKNGPVRYHKIVVFRRDNWLCQYCSRPLSKRDATIDHVIPLCQGGLTNYKNCVTSCKKCNHTKAFKTPDEAGMALMTKPSTPNILHLYNVSRKNGWHPEWDSYLGYMGV